MSSKKTSKLSIFFKMLKCIYINTIQNTTLPTKYPAQEKLVIVNNPDAKPQSIPKIIWMYWEDDAIPLSVQKMIDAIKELHPQHDIHVLSDKTYNSFLPDLEIKGQMPIANKTDLIRLALLHQFGGIWMDCTIILRDSFDWIHEIAEKEAFDIVAHYNEDQTTDNEYPVIETWLLAAAPNNHIIKRWLDVLMPLKDLGSKQYYEELKKIPNYDLIKQNIPIPHYLLVFVALQVALRERKDFNLHLRKCQDSAFYLQEYYNWSKYKMTYALCRLENVRPNLSMIKLTSNNRSLIETFRKWGLIKKNSTMGLIMNS
ncbi:glycosyltransferase family 32 protein [Pedobacter ureilyticus]|uniref:Glycosyltransferase family 32 protein n=1 Tax=Pedobacter ureilyticus TaxID=1393051 RepID=A0ABW9J547_9SPHI|nr:capsular polysaccharide synthesis protein [Pedobacter helvus]